MYTIECLHIFKKSDEEKVIQTNQNKLSAHTLLSLLLQMYHLRDDNYTRIKTIFCTVFSIHFAFVFFFSFSLFQLYSVLYFAIKSELDIETPA